MRAWRAAILGAVVIAAVIAAVVLGPSRHGASFHAYAGERWPLVLSNLPFVIVGIVGVVRRRGAMVRALFGSVAAIGVGSAAYHWAPSDATLVLDWIPIGVSGALLTAVNLGDRVHRRAGVIAAFALPLLAIASVAFWYAGGGTDGGDMRWYGLLEILDVALVPIVVIVFPEGRLTRAWLGAGVAAFVLARVAAAHDQELLGAIGVSGHTWKHLLAGVAVACVLRAVPHSR